MKKDFECLPCPFGADCSQNNIVNHPNFGGALVKKKILQHFNFTFALLTTVILPGITSFQSTIVVMETALVCYVEHALRSTARRFSLMSAGAMKIAMTRGFGQRHFILSVHGHFLGHQASGHSIFDVTYLLWFKNTESKENPKEKGSEDILKDNNNEISTDEGYLKVVFYYYQVANLLYISTTGQTVQGHFLVSLMVIFNFQVKTSSSGFGCPFPRPNLHH